MSDVTNTETTENASDKKDSIGSEGIAISTTVKFFDRWGVKFIAAIFILGVLIGVSIGASLLIMHFNPKAAVATSIVIDINIALISITATLFGLYITAFIFLNDSLKNRTKDDPTMRGSVKRIIARYRDHMKWIAFSTVIAIVIGVVCNIFLGRSSENESTIALNDWRWMVFVGVVVVSVAIVAWIINASKNITSSDKLIRDESSKNLKDYEHKLQIAFRELKGDRGETDTDKNDKPKNDSDAPKQPVTVTLAFFKNMTGKDILKTYGSKDYTLKSAYDNVLSNLKNSDKWEYQSDFLISIGKTVRFLESIVGRICDNNIDKSIMNNENIYNSMRNGFLWLYAGGVGKVAGDGEAKSVSLIDVRDKNRFFDHLKYQIITDKRFSNIPFNNEEVEEAYDRARAAFDALPFNNEADKSKSADGQTQTEYIDKYKQGMRDIINRFFAIYENLIGYRDALVHYDKYDKIVKKPKKEKKNDKEDITLRGNIYMLAETLKRVLIDRFASFVKTNDLNLGNSILNKGWFNYSELTDSNFTHSSFKFARLENAILRHCDLSTCNFICVDASDTDFSESNFSYSNLTGMDLTNSNLNKAQMNRVLFRDSRIDTYIKGFELMDNVLKINEQGPVSIATLTGGMRDWHLKNIRSVSPNDTRAEEELAEKLEKLRNGDALRHIVDAFRPRMGDCAEGEFAVLINNETPGTAILTTVKGKHRSSILNRSYKIAVHETIKDFVLYRKYSKIDRNIAKLLPLAREAEIIISIKGEKEKISGGDAYKRPETKEPRVEAKCSDTNRKKREEQYGKVVFAVAKLKAASLNEVTMADTDLSHVNMDDASFRNSALSRAQMYYTSAKNVMFWKTNLNNLDAYESDFSHSNFLDASLINAVIADCNLNGCNFKKTLLLNSVIINTQKDKWDFKIDNDNVTDNADLSADCLYVNRFMYRGPAKEERTDFVVKMLEHADDEERIYTENLNGEFHLDENANIQHINDIDPELGCTNAEFEDAIADDIQIINMNMMRSDFSRISAKNGFFYNDILRWCEFANAEMNNSIFVGDSFHQSRLSNVKFARSRFVACEFTNVNLMNANLISTYIDNCVFEDADLSECKMFSAHVKSCTFIKCNFRKALLGGAKFENVLFYLTDLSDVIGLEETKFIHCAFVTTKSGTAERGDEFAFAPIKFDKVTLDRDDVKYKNQKHKEIPTYSSDTL